MKTTQNFFGFFILLFICLISCSKEDVSDDGMNNPSDIEMGSILLEITDAPIDDASVHAAFVTISEIHLNGTKIEGFSKMTVEVSDLQNGKTELLVAEEIETGTYDELVLTLDFEKDENGNSPGCYMEETDGTKHSLTSSSNTILVNMNTTIESGEEKTLVVDFDLRKCIQYENSSNDRFEFVSKSELESSIRVVDKGQSGSVNGSITTTLNTGSKLVVYAYKKGWFDSTAEMTASGESMLMFRNCETSGLVDGNGKFSIHFLEEGTYELYIASYEDTDEDGRLELQGMLTTDLLGNIRIIELQVKSNTSLSVDLELLSILPV